MANKVVIDVSTHQGVIDWEKVKPQIDYAILRVGYGDNIQSQDDKQFSRNASECERLGIPYGVYIYSYARTTAQAKSEAQHVLRLIKGKKLSLPVYYDLEEAKLASVMLSNWNAFYPIIKQAGYRCGIYTGQTYWNGYLKNAKEVDSIWLARYGRNDGTLEGSIKPVIDREFDLWQYTSRKTFNGIKGGVDTSIVLNDPAIVEKKEATKKETKTETKKASAPTYTKGKTYKIQVDALTVRKSFSKYSAKIPYKSLTLNARLHAYKNGTLKKGTRVSCKGTAVDKNGDVWIKIPSGWIAAYYSGNIYVK